MLTRTPLVIDEARKIDWGGTEVGQAAASAPQGPQKLAKLTRALLQGDAGKYRHHWARAVERMEKGGAKNPFKLRGV